MSLIPKKIFQSWKTKNPPPKIQENIRKIREMNPEYEYILFDDNDCRQFLQKHFGDNYANAFDELIPGAFKCDFWRYAVMYIVGGVYIDIDMTPLVPFREMFSDKDEFVSIVDRTVSNYPGIFQSFIACRTAHPIMRTSLDLAFYNIVSKRNNLFNTGILSITGPGVVAVAVNLFLGKKNTTSNINKGKYNNIVLFHVDSSNEYTYDLKDKKIFKNKFKGYSGQSYGIMDTFKNDPMKNVGKFAIIGLLLLVILLLLSVYFAYKSRKRLTECKAKLIGL